MQHGLKPHHVTEVAAAVQQDRIALRSGAAQLLELLQLHRVPVVIDQYNDLMTDVIDCVLQQYNIHSSNHSNIVLCGQQCVFGASGKLLATAASNHLNTMHELKVIRDLNSS